MKTTNAAFGAITLLAVFGTSSGDSRASGAERQRQNDPSSVVTVDGVIEPQVLVNIAPTVDGVLREITPAGEDAAVVKKSDVLARIDPARYETDLAIAKTELQRARAALVLAKAKVTLAELELEKARKSPDKSGDDSAIALARAALDVAKAGVVSEEANVAHRKALLGRAEANVSACTIRSPIDGITIDRRVNVGQFVSAAASSPSLFLIASDLKKLDVWAQVPETEIARIVKGQPATLTVTAFPNRTFKAQVKQIRLNAANERNQVTYTVVLDCDNSDGRLLPYMSAKVAIEVGEPR
jgi:HlyD family secretion protein